MNKYIAHLPLFLGNITYRTDLVNFWLIEINRTDLFEFFCIKFMLSLCEVLIYILLRHISFKIAYARLEGDYIVCAAYSHELPRYS